MTDDNSIKAVVVATQRYQCSGCDELCALLVPKSIEVPYVVGASICIMWKDQMGTWRAINPEELR
jgi:hypothetical protein